jgi:tRNA (cytidine/uridine-2'-O-)-methyltransferase
MTQHGLHVVLFEPEIPPNTGNIARTCAATGTPLHLIQPLGFSVDEPYVRRAGLDYWSRLTLHRHDGWDQFHRTAENGRLALLSTKGEKRYTEITEEVPLYLVFGPETRGLPTSLLGRYQDLVYRIPMGAEIRSLNLSNSVAVVLYDLLRRLGFPGLE